MSDSRPLKVKAVARLSGVSAHTLRAWERRYQAVTPIRTDTGRRIYTTEDVARLRQLGELVDRGFSIGGIANLPKSELATLLESSAARDRGVGKESFGELSPNLILSQLMSALERFDLPTLSQELESARDSHEPRDYILSVIAPLLAEVGMQVMRGMLSIAQEHALSAVIRGQLGSLLEKSNRRSAASGREPAPIAFATASGDQNEFGTLMSAILCATRGVQAHYLGPNLPPDEFARSAKALGVKAIVLGTTPLPPGELKLGYEEYVAQLDRTLPEDCEIWLGGRGNFNFTEHKGKRTLRQIATLELLESTLVQWSH